MPESTAEIETAVSDSSAKQTRERSTIAFPYDDLEAAIGVAEAVHELGGGNLGRSNRRPFRNPQGGAGL